MGRKVNPIGFRLKINKTWEGRWYAEGDEYVQNLHQDFHLRELVRGEAPKAFVRLKEGHDATAQELMEFLRPKLSKLELPAKIEFRAELPKTMIGKLSKKCLRAEEVSAHRDA